MNQNGFTLLEMLVSLSILTIVIASSLNFYEDYFYRSNELGEYYTAKNLTAGALEMERTHLLTTANTNPHQTIKKVNGVTFLTETLKEDVTPQFSIFAPDHTFIKITAKTTWKQKELEAETYVSVP